MDSIIFFLFFFFFLDRWTLSPGIANVSYGPIRSPCPEESLMIDQWNYPRNFYPIFVLPAPERFQFAGPTTGVRKMGEMRQTSCDNVRLIADGPNEIARRDVSLNWIETKYLILRNDLYKVGNNKMRFHFPSFMFSSRQQFHLRHLRGRVSRDAKIVIFLFLHPQVCFFIFWLTRRTNWKYKQTDTTQANDENQQLTRYTPTKKKKKELRYFCTCVRVVGGTFILLLSALQFDLVQFETAF